DPTAPPGTERPSPQAPPGTLTAPPTAMPSQAERPGTGTQTPAGQQPTTTVPFGDPATTAPLAEPNLPAYQPRPVPPLPSLTRVGVNTGETLPLTLNDAIRLALENNNDIEVARQEVRLVESNLRALRGVYDPVIEFNPQFSQFISPQESSLGGADAAGTVKQTDIQWNPSFNRLFEVGGGQVQTFFNNNRRTTTSTFNNLTPVYSANLGATFTQPLWRDRSIDRFRRDIRIQRKRLEQSDADFRRRTIEVIAAVQRSYWDLVFALRDEQNQIANLNLARENFRRTEASVAAGSSAPLERAEVQTELSNREAALLLASQTVAAAENTLKSLLLRDPLAPQWSVAVLPTDTPTFDATPISLQDAVAEARANRPELRRLRLQQEANDIDIKYFKNQTKPRVDLQGTFSTTGLAGSPAAELANLPANGVINVPLIDPTAANTSATAFLLNQINLLRTQPGINLGTITPPTVEQQVRGVPTNLVGGYGQTLQNLFSLDTRNIVVGVRIQLPWHNRTAEANLASARIAQEQLNATTRSQELFVEVEVRNAVQAVETARRRVLAARVARENAEVQLAGERRLYQVGRTTTFLLFQRENQLVNARNLELRAETDYNKALAELQRATSTTLRANNVVISSPFTP
ncbi:MAG TPA: TolC family protein, partial [Pyrinomonadaceae bacterium]|nr:TolC family protein [Pyrinomonadaceae bacterium]